mmetsp:Transcript_94678/g.203277  ORF Transcript_94678/g.203277 Transcript_94678/m.203277 type:complete len:210 (-) Transcript_94678:192-821(-)
MMPRGEAAGRTSFPNGSSLADVSCGPSWEAVRPKKPKGKCTPPDAFEGTSARRKPPKKSACWLTAAVVATWRGTVGIVDIWPAPSGATSEQPPSTVPTATLTAALRALVDATTEGKCPVPSGSGSSGSAPSARPRRFLRYHSAALVPYFCAMGMESEMPCSLKNAFSFLFPPSSISFSWAGFQASIVVERTKLRWTPRLRWTPAASTLR